MRLHYAGGSSAWLLHALPWCARACYLLQPYLILWLRGGGKASHVMRVLHMQSLLLWSQHNFKSGSAEQYGMVD